jgi:hypothetical protein
MTISLQERDAKGGVNIQTITRARDKSAPPVPRAAAKVKAKAANKKSSNTDGTIIPFEAAVRQGRVLWAEITKGDRASMRLGELADKIEPRYADRTLKKYADEIGALYETVKRCRTTYRQWVKIGAPAPHSYAAAQVLHKHPDAAAIASNKPDITKDEASKLVQEYKQRTDKSKGADGNRKHHEGWQREVHNVATMPSAWPRSLSSR